MNPPDRPRFKIVVEAQPWPDGPLPERRLARLLKALLRSYRFRALEVREIKPDQDAREGHGGKSA